jgi:hypothetical protein
MISRAMHRWVAMPNSRNMAERQVARRSLLRSATIKLENHLMLREYTSCNSFYKWHPFYAEPLSTEQIDTLCNFLCRYLPRYV